MKIKFILALALLLCTQKGVCAVDFPVQSKVKIVSDGMLVNSKKVKAWTFTSPLNSEEITEYYRLLWQPKSTQFDSQKLGRWHIINAMIDGVQYTAKIALTSATHYVSSAEKPDSELRSLNKKLRYFPSPDGTQVITDIKAKDGVKISNTLLMKNSLTIKQNLNFYMQYYTKYGWNIDNAVFTKNNDNGVFMARKGPNNINITINADKGFAFITAVRVDVEL